MAAREIDAQLLELAVKVGALQPHFLRHPAHVLAFLGDVVFKIAPFQLFAQFAQRHVEIEAAHDFGVGVGGELTEDIVDGLLAHFAGKEWKPETRKGAKNACVSYFRWLKASGRSEADPSEFLPTVKRPEQHPRPCPDVVILTALRKATDSDRLMLRLGAECGLSLIPI